MIKLKNLLMESTYAPSKQAGPTWIDNKWDPAHTKSVLERVRYSEYIPLTPSAVEKALGKKIPIRSFHITIIYYGKQIKNQYLKLVLL